MCTDTFNLANWLCVTSDWGQMMMIPDEQKEECPVCMDLMTTLQPSPSRHTYALDQSPFDPHSMVTVFSCSHGLCSSCAYDIISQKALCCARCPICRADPSERGNIWFLWNTHILQLTESDHIPTRTERRTSAAIQAVRNCLSSENSRSFRPRRRRVRP